MIIRAFLQEGQFTNAQDSFGSSALHVAARTRHDNVVQSLLEKGADHAVRDMLENPTLYWAAVAGCESSVRMLPDRESNTAYDRVTAHDKERILEAALLPLESNAHHGADLLLHKGGCVNERNGTGR